MPLKPRSYYHIAAVFTVVVWGVTFVSTKALLARGLTPASIFLLRFIMAYAGIWIMCARPLFARNIRDELLMAGAGITGGSLYFLFENTALRYTLASNVGFLLSGAPLITALLMRVFYRDQRIGREVLIGAAVALGGVCLVVFNGSFVLKLNPVGDILTMLAAVSWAFYSVIMRRLSGRYTTLFITRKIFFYGLLTIIPFVVKDRSVFDTVILSDPVVICNLLFLGLVASLLCFILWNSTLKHIGTVTASNYLYFVPVVTLVASALLLNERITLLAMAGSALILSGVYFAGSKRKGF